jgi:hypothetical protein
VSARVPRWLLGQAQKFRARIEPHLAADTALGAWDRGTPGKGHCAVASLLLRAHLGGQAEMAGVRTRFVSTTVEGSSHWLVRVEEDGVGWDVDVTADQFGHAAVRVGPAGSLYPAPMRPRADSDLNDATRERALLLAARAGVGVPAFALAG